MSATLHLDHTPAGTKRQGALGLSDAEAASRLSRDGFNELPSARPRTLAAIGWLFSFAQKEGKTDAFVAQHKAKAEAANATPRDLWNWVNLQAMRADEDALLPATRKLNGAVRTPDAMDEILLYEAEPMTVAQGVVKDHAFIAIGEVSSAQLLRMIDSAVK